MMNYQLQASGGIFDVDTISQYEQMLGEGDRGLLELDLRWSAPSWVAGELERRLRQQGVEEVKVTTGSPIIRIQFRQGFPWLAVIAAAVLGLVVLFILIMSWRIFKDVIPEVLQPIAAGAGIVLIAALGIMLLRRTL